MYRIKRLWLEKDPKAYKDWSLLLRETKIDVNEKLDYSAGIYQGDRLIATGSYQRNILKCLSVAEEFQSENLLTQLVIHLLERLREENQTHYFLYTKPSNQAIFQSLGFHEIVKTDQILFMEQGLPTFEDYLEYSSRKKKGDSASGIVMNANPFTKGHQYLVERAAQESPFVYVFVLSEDRSEFSTEDRLEMVKRGVAHLKNVEVLLTGDYLISSATFPTYFLKDQTEAKKASQQAELDALLFKEKIAPALAIQRRFVGDEPYSEVTEIYNETMQKIFGEELTLSILPRIAVEGEIVSATKVRAAYQQNNQELLSRLLPATTYDYLKEQIQSRGEEEWKSSKKLSLGQ
ncbi:MULTISPECIES: [citrate (pro-3S)-lyase] ligase [Enterococcus]|uniref:[citrate (pro-3S)-lyase] ligase n=1 Tax=Enterococcus TaxID=1350 RepID=UPI000ED385B9|nr:MULTISPECIES: [citrate (pro-3S)-lyase] ligase [Enterococcus]HCM84560.1 [citrate (pro-3S)-lyase] ligase [Enterococcus sp.]